MRGIGGIESIKQHAKGKKHSQRVILPSNNKTISFFSNKQDNSNKTESAPVPVQSIIPYSVSKQQTTEAEIMWALEVLSCKYSYRSCETKGYLFCSMFPESKIAQQFSCGKTKCSYLFMSWYCSLCKRNFDEWNQGSVLLCNHVW